MAINKKLITFANKATFIGANGTKGATTATDGFYGNIPARSIVFIKDTGEIWHNGVYFSRQLPDLISSGDSTSTDSNKGIVYKQNANTFLYGTFSLWGNTFDGSSKTINGDLKVNSNWTFGGASTGNGYIKNSTHTYLLFKTDKTIQVPIGNIEVSDGTLSATQINNTPSYFSNFTKATSWDNIKVYSSTGTTQVPSNKALVTSVPVNVFGTSDVFEPWITSGSNGTTWSLGLDADGDLSIVSIDKTKSGGVTHQWKFTDDGLLQLKNSDNTFSSVLTSAVGTTYQLFAGAANATANTTASNPYLVLKGSDAKYSNIQLNGNDQIGISSSEGIINFSLKNSSNYFRNYGTITGYTIADISNPLATEMANANKLSGSFGMPLPSGGNGGHLFQSYDGGNSTAYLQLYASYPSSLFWRASKDSILSGREWRTVLDSVNYASFAADKNHTHAYTALTGYGTTANQAIVTTGSGWTLKTLGDRAFDSNTYLLAKQVSVEQTVSWAQETALKSIQKGYVYNTDSTEYSYLFGMRDDAIYGTILKWGYSERYLRILRYSNGQWHSTDWEKINAGYADSAGYAVSAGYAESISTIAPQLAAASEQNAITVLDKPYMSSSYYGKDFDNTDCAIPKAIDFQHYASHWAIGNLRNGSEGSSGFGFFYKTDSDTYWSLKAKISTTGYVYAPGVYTQNATYLAVNSGYVGIGTTSPSYKLHVYSNVSPCPLKVSTASANSDSFIYFSAGGTNVAAVGRYNGLCFIGAESSSYAKLGILASTGEPQYWTDSAGTNKYTLYHTGTFTLKTGVSTVSNTAWESIATADKIVPTMNTLSWWNGAYNSSGASNLAYCNKGAFGSIVTKSSDNYLAYAGMWASSDTTKSADNATGMLFCYGSHGFPNTYGVAITASSNISANYKLQICGEGTEDNDLYFRNKGDAGWGSWKKVAVSTDLDSYLLKSSTINIAGTTVALNGGSISAATIGNALTSSAPAAYATEAGKTSYLRKNGYIACPNGGTYTTTTASFTGYLRIKLPVLWSATRVLFYVDICDYSSQIAIVQKHTTYKIAGYLHSSKNWFSGTAQCVSQYRGALKDIPISFGKLDGYPVVQFGTASTVWLYPQVVIRDVYLGYTNYLIPDWDNDWTIDFSTAELDTTNFTCTNPAFIAWKATALTASAGNSTTPVYFSNGVPTACSYTLGKSVPANAVFTDTTYTSKDAASGGTEVSLVTTGEKATWNAKTSNVGTITGITMNGSSKGTSGVVDLGTVLTSGSQTTTSTADGGSNVYTFSDGSTITIKNGSKGSSGTNGTTPTIKAASGSNIGTVGTPSVTASTSGTTTTFTFNYLKGAKGDKGDAGTNATTTAVATSSANGLMSSSDKSKLDGIATGANAYTHPTTSGNKHIPSGGSSGQILRWSADGTAVWGADNNTTYSAATTSANGLMTAADKKLLDVRNNPVGTCATGRATAAKVVTLANFVLTVGTVIAVKFTDTAGTANPTSGNLTLNVNNTGAKNIGYYRNGSKGAFSYGYGAYFYNNATHIFSYDGTYWLCMDFNVDNNTTYSVATTSVNGLMSSTDKSKLDGIATGANNYSLPTASSSTLGGVKIGSNITNTSGTISLTKANVTSALGYTPPTSNTTYSVATTSANGLMSSTDKSKLDDIEEGANCYTHPSYTARSSGLYKVTVDSTGHVSAVASVTKSDITALGIPSSDTNTTYSAGTGISFSGTTIYNSGVRSISTGSLNGTISVNTGGTTANVAVKGLGSAAYTASTAYATSGHTHSGYLSTSGGTVTGAITFDGNDDYGIFTSAENHCSIGSSSAYFYRAYINNIYAATLYEGSAQLSEKYAAISHTHSNYLTGITKAMVVNALGYTPPTTDTNTTYSNATTSTAGLMSASDKSKLDGIASGANNYTYTLPTASSSTLGGVKSGSSVTSTSGYTACPIISGIPYYKDTNTTYSSLKNPYSLSLTVGSNSAVSYDGSAAKSVSITCSTIGAATSGHTHLYAGSSSAGGAATKVTLTSSSSSSSIPFIFGSSSTLYYNDGVYCIPSACSIYASSFYETSDITLKDVKSFPDLSVEKLAKLPIFNFTWKKGDSSLHLGTSAQAVQQVLPNIVSGTKALTVDYGVLGTVTGVAACRELLKHETEIEELRNEIKILKEKIKSYENR